MQSLVTKRKIELEQATIKKVHIEVTYVGNKNLQVKQRETLNGMKKKFKI